MNIYINPHRELILTKSDLGYSFWRQNERILRLSKDEMLDIIVNVLIDDDEKNIRSVDALIRADEKDTTD